MKFLHTSDIWLGYAFPFTREVAERFREKRLQAVRDIVALAQQHQVDALVFAGNTLADNRILRYTVEDLSDCLTACDCPVLILPGILDPFTPDSPFRTRADLFPQPVRVLDGTSPVTIEGVDFFSFPILNRDGETAAQSPASPGERPSVGIACVSPEDYESSTLVEHNFTYLAMGGTTREQAAAENRSWSGAPEASCLGESRGSVSLIEIVDGRTSVSSLPTGSLQWLEQEWPFQSLENLASEVDAFKDASQTKLELKLTGSMSFRDLGAFNSWLEQTRPRFLDFTVVSPPELVVSDEDLYSHPLLRQVTETLLERSAQSADWYDPASPSEPESARWALAHIQQLLQEEPHEDLM